MSPHVGNFVQDLVEMAKAMEALPQVQAELNRVNALNDRQSQAIAEREESILRLKAEVESLNQKVRDAEVARDNAELMFLESDERANNSLAALAALENAMGAVRTAIAPPKPEPVAEPKPEPVYPNWTDDAFTSSEDKLAVNQGLSGQSANPPSAEPSPGQSDAGQGHAQPQDAGSIGGVGSEGKPSVGSEEWPKDYNAETERMVTEQSGQSEPTPTTAPPAQTGTGTASVASSYEIGYHNEPNRWGDDGYATSAWWSWSDLMDLKYGVNQWPARPTKA